MEDFDDDSDPEEGGFDLCEECRTRIPPGGIAFMSQDAAILFLESCEECSARLNAMIGPPPLIEA